MSDERPIVVVGRRPSADDERAKAEARRIWEEDRAQLVFRQPFLATLALYLEIVPVVDCRLATAATDGGRVYVDPYFLKTLTPEERLFVLAHEVWHCALSHFTRRQGRRPRLWNVAIDHEVNALLRREGLQMPNSAVYFPEHEGRNAEAVYDWLQSQPNLDDDSDLLARGPLGDDHLDDEAPPEPGVGTIDPDYAPGLSADELDRWPERVLAAAQQAERLQADLPAELQRLVEGVRRPTLPWRELLRQFVTRVFGGKRVWLPPNRRYVSRGLYLPSRREERVRVVVALDTSGSTYGDIPDFVSEMASLMAAFGRYEVVVVHCDAAVKHVETWTPERPPPTGEGFRIHGGGGTDFRPVFDYVRDELEPPDCLVYLTDGYGDAPNRPAPYPTLWVLTADGRAPASWGEVARLVP